MDIARPDILRKRKARLVIFGAAALVAVPAVTIGVSRLKSAAPLVERSSVSVDTVRRGEMLREMRGLGTLVPVDIRWIPAQSSARVDRVVLQSGARINPESVILELSDPQLERDTLDAEYSYRASQADLANLKVQLASNLMVQKSAAADVESEYQQAKVQAEADKQLADQGLEAAIVSQKSTVVAQQLAIKRDLIQQHLQIADEAAKAQIAAQEAHLDQQRVLYELKKSQMNAMHVRAGLNGVLSAVSVDVGQQVNPGTNLVRVADPSHLKATIQIPETQAKDLAPRLQHCFYRCSHRLKVRGDAPDRAEYRHYLFRYVATEAGRLQLPVHIHTGAGSGGYDSDPLLLESRSTMRGCVKLVLCCCTGERVHLRER